MELRRYFIIVRRRWLLIVLTLVAGMAAGYATTSRTPVYTADSTIYIGARVLSIPGLPSGTVSADLTLGTQQIIKTFSAMVRSEPIAQDALKRTGLQRSVGSVVGATTAAPQVDTSLLHVQVSDPDPAIAAQLANAMSDSFVDRISNIQLTTPPKPGDPPQLPAYVFAPASLPTVPASTGLTRHLILGGMFGLVASVGLAFLLEYLDLTLKSATDAERRLELPVLGVIPLERQIRPTPVRAELTRVG